MRPTTHSCVSCRKKTAGDLQQRPETVELNIPVNNTPLETAHQLESVFGKNTAQLLTGNVHVSMPAQTLAVFSVH